MFDTMTVWSAEATACDRLALNGATGARAAARCAAALAFDRIVANCLELDWVVDPDVASPAKGRP